MTGDNIVVRLLNQLALWAFGFAGSGAFSWRFDENVSAHEPKALLEVF